jgi:hypothetical protein
MEDNEWAHEGSKWSWRVVACTSSYVAKWFFCKHLEWIHSLRMQIGRLGHPYTRSRGPRQQDHGSMNVRILSNLHARQKWNEKKAFDQMKK